MSKKINIIEDQEKGLKIGEEWSGNLSESESDEEKNKEEVDDTEDEEENNGD
jgi:hypothetical protein